MTWRLEKLDVPQDLRQFQDYSGIYEYPDNSDKLVRLYACGAEDARTVAKEGQILYDDLSAYGITTVSPIFSAAGKHAVATIVDKVDGESFSPDDTIHESTLSPAQRLNAASVLEELYAYVQRKVFEGSDQILLDVYSLYQYMFTEDNRVVLVDVDPLYTGGQDLFTDQCFVVQALAESVAMYNAGNVTELESWRSRYDRLLEKIFTMNKYYDSENLKAKLVDTILGIAIPDSAERYDESDDLIHAVVIDNRGRRGYNNQVN